MTLNTQQEVKQAVRRRASTPITTSRYRETHKHPSLGQSTSLQAPSSSDSEESDSSEHDCLYRVMLLGDHGVGKSSLVDIFAGGQDNDTRKYIGGKKVLFYFDKKKSNRSSLMQYCHTDLCQTFVRNHFLLLNCF